MYLGSKGYTIPKSLLTPAQQKTIRNDLTFKPYSSYGTSTLFSVYRESPLKLYVPRFYGMEHFGPVSSKLPLGTDIDVPFEGTLRKEQQPILDAFLACATTKGCGLVELPCGFGKTILALYLIHKLRTKTLVIVHKEFLLEQWIERIQEFLPTARVGRIQGQRIDIDNKDIVIGMLQSLSMKEYPTETFQSFGFTIVDETHHIAAEVFSQALFQIVTPYMLGLSATMVRKDGLTKIFKLFLGEIEYKAIREKMDVRVQVIHYRVQDDEFNDTLYNGRGDPHYALMIKKLCEFNPRRDFILRILKDAVQQPSNEQIMILSHNKSLLTYLYEGIQHQQIATVGYYVGAMKTADLKQTEQQKIILATYAMAEEALDIKTLTTLIMCTPKTNVTQAVGRILRVKHAQPLVIDIVDVHPMFLGQWNKRKTFYKKSGYTMVQCTSLQYPDWKPLEKSVCLL
jgi:superfamily II DNA or RNA helicase